MWAYIFHRREKKKKNQDRGKSEFNSGEKSIICARCAYFWNLRRLNIDQPTKLRPRKQRCNEFLRFCEIDE